MSEEKLIKELDTLMIRELYIGESTWDELDEENRATVVEAWQKAIALIGKAYADGMPLPGEKERIKIGPSAKAHLSPYLLTEVGDIVIALRKEENK